MVAKSQQLQIRVTPIEKAALKCMAAGAGQDVSSYVLSRALPPAQLRIQGLLEALTRADERRFALAELNDVLTGLAAIEWVDALDRLDLRGLSALDRNYVAAMVEEASRTKEVRPPAWATEVAPLPEPWFATPMKSLRLHLLRTAPVAFKRRNIFIDSSVGDRV